MTADVSNGQAVRALSEADLGKDRSLPLHDALAVDRICREFDLAWHDDSGRLAANRRMSNSTAKSSATWQMRWMPLLSKSDGFD